MSQLPTRSPRKSTNILHYVAWIWLLLFLVACTPAGSNTGPGSSAIATSAPVDRLVPTPAATSTTERAATEPVDTPRPTAEIAPDMPTPSPAPSLPAPHTLRWRAGVGIPDGGHPHLYQWTAPRPGWYLNWHYGTLTLPDLPPGAVPTSVPPPLDSPGAPDYLALEIQIPDELATGMHYVPMIYDLDVATETLRHLVAHMPGRTWLIGNEPDVRWQGNRTPESYARAYHRIYHLIKDADPQAQVAIGGISQVTPLRLAYLDRVLDTYHQEFDAPMPVDVWNIHTFILQEKRDDWGVDIPPGFETIDQGTLWTIEDHGDLSLVEQQIRTMRAWMRSKGEHDKPLWITEYGILMPAEFGFEPEVVADFMVASFDLFQNLTDPNLGWAEDEHRLVQRWIWFSTGYDSYPTGNLFDRRGQPTLLMQTYSNYLAQHEAKMHRDGILGCTINSNCPTN